MHELEKQTADKAQDHAMEYMGVLQRAQQKTKSAHVVLSGINAIKTADVANAPQPRQGARAKGQQEAEERAVGRLRHDRQHDDGAAASAILLRAPRCTLVCAVVLVGCHS